MGRRLFKELERSYGFDEVAIVPGQVTINPELTSTKMTIGRPPNHAKRQQHRNQTMRGTRQHRPALDYSV